MNPFEKGFILPKLSKTNKEMIKDPTYSAEKALADFIAQVNEAVELYRLTNGIT